MRTKQLFYTELLQAHFQVRAFDINLLAEGNAEETYHVKQ